MEPQFENQSPLKSVNAAKDGTTCEEFLWCQELAVTLDPFDPQKLTPRQIVMLNHFGWQNEIGDNGFELTQKILKMLHKHSQQSQSDQK